ncbi:MAG TPA: hypothetical protein DD648_04385, partial [Candidatus Omnitrophica bacterium]|nr:hypothetical protein [Candidatus Omnitrophota bacterium]
FIWTTNPAAAQYYLWLGTAPNTKNVGNINAGSNTSVTVTVPLDGTPLYASIWSRVNGIWVKDHEASYTRSNKKALITSPVPGSQITTTSVMFAWTANPAATQYYLWLGTAPSINNVGNINAGMNTSVIVNVPLDGTPLYASIWSRVNGIWVKDHEVSYTRADQRARIISPAPGSQIDTANVTFIWTTNPAAAQYYLWLGTAPNTKNVGNINAGSNTSVTVTVPLDGTPLYASIWSKVNGIWVKDHEANYTRILQ